jgi:hypothetical protein
LSTAGESWYNFQDFKNFNNSSNYTSPSVNVNIKKSQYTPGNQIFINKINLVFKLVDVNRLAIDCQQMCANMFLKISSSLPNLDMIKITSSPSNIDLLTSNENSEIYNLFVKNNNITKLSLRDISEIEYIYLIMNLFPRIQSFAIHIPGRSFQQSDLIGSVSDSNRNPTRLDENFINRRNPIGFLVEIRHPDP